MCVSCVCISYVCVCVCLRNYELVQAVPFTSPPSLEKTFTLPNRGTVKGMGIPPGVTLIVGGGSVWLDCLHCLFFLEGGEGF